LTDDRRVWLACIRGSKKEKAVKKKEKEKYLTMKEDKKKLSNKVGKYMEEKQYGRPFKTTVHIQQKTPSHPWKVRN